jgi:hypothetical protein
MVGRGREPRPQTPREHVRSRRQRVTVPQAASNASKTEHFSREPPMCTKSESTTLKIIPQFSKLNLRVYKASPDNLGFIPNRNLGTAWEPISRRRMIIEKFSGWVRGHRPRVVRRYLGVWLEIEIVAIQPQTPVHDPYCYVFFLFDRSPDIMFAHDPVAIPTRLIRPCDELRVFLPIRILETQL